MNEKIEHEGVISRIEEGKTWVTIVQGSACADCHVKSMCQISGQKEKNIEIPYTEASYKPGHKVLVVGKASMGLQAVLYAFVIPLIFITASLICSLSWFKSESIAALTSIIVLVIYFGTLYMFKDKFKKKFVFTIKNNI